MNLSQVTGLILIVVPIVFNVIFLMLQKSFEYPDILRKPTEHIMSRFIAGGRRLVVLWYVFALTSVLFIPLAILLPQVLTPGDALFVSAMTTLGVLAGIVQFLGLIRWSFLVPYLAKTYSAPDSAAATRESVAVVFQAFHRYAGVAIGEHLGYLFTGAWTALVSLAMMRLSPFGAWLGWLGFVPAIGIVVGMLEVGGFKPAGAINAISYILWSLWLIGLGAILFLR